MEFTVICYVAPITVAAQSEVWTVFAHSNTGSMGSNPTQGMDVFVQVAALQWADSPSKEPYRLCKKIK
jgi:hypothetical protein